MSTPGMESEVMSVTDDERIDAETAAKLLGRSKKTIQRYRERLRGALELQPVTQPAAVVPQKVLMVSKAAVLALQRELDGEQSADDPNV